MRIELGQPATLAVVKLVDFGCYLDGGPFGEVLLPMREMPEGTAAGDEVDVFLYCDSEDRVIATTLQPLAYTEQFVALQVVETTEIGAFLDWGIPTKHLLVPFKEQHTRMVAGRKYVVYVYLDDRTDRIVATSKLARYVSPEATGLEPNDAVSILVVERNRIGYRVIVNQRHWGMLYENEVFEALQVGDTRTAYVKKLREDHKIDLSLQPLGYDASIDADTQQLLDALVHHGGYLPLGDKSAPELIQTHIGLSKKRFKKAVGHLLKLGRLSIEDDGLHLRT